MSIFKSHTDDPQADARPDEASRDADRDLFGEQSTGKHDDLGDRPSHETTATEDDRSDVAPDEQLGGDRPDGWGGSDATTETTDPAASAPAGEPRNDINGAGPGTANGETPAAAASSGGAAERAATASGNDEPERLVPQDRADAYSSRWESVKSGFVDEPRDAVGQADALVGELLDELQEAFSNQRKRLEDGLDADTTSTEDLRLALRRYRSFFDRLVSF